MHNTDELIEKIKNVGVIACMRGGFTSAMAIKVGTVLIEEGIYIFEFTMNSEDPLGTLTAVKAELGDSCIVGMGTVLSVEDADNAIAAGAEFIMAPCFDPVVFERVHSQGILMAPGVTTPTEVMQAHKAGARLLKLFPVGPFGVEYLRAMRGPLNTLNFFCDGRIPIEELPEYISAGAVACGQVEGLTGDGTENPEVIKRKAIKLLAEIKEARKGIQ